MSSQSFTQVSRKERDLMIRVLRNISEAAKIGKLVLQLKADDRMGIVNDVDYRIDRRSDPKRQFTIDENGTLSLAGSLDREEIPKYELRIEAAESNKSNDDLYVDVTVNDVNDNAPNLYIFQPSNQTFLGPCIFMENTDPDEILPCEVRGSDPDTNIYGPPFNMTVAGKFKELEQLEISFDETLDGGNGGMTIKPLKTLDREKKKVFKIPIEVSDVGGKTAIRTVEVIVGDKNDNPMSNANMTIEVYLYENFTKDQYIGTVYVQDEDDWDINNKTFEMQAEHEFFTVEKDTGRINMLSTTLPGLYTFTVDVTDNSRDNDHAQSFVTVKVYPISKVAFDHQAGIRISGDSHKYNENPGYFLQGPRENFLQKLDEKLKNLGKENIQIDVFSLQRSEFEGTYDLRFTVNADGRYLSKSMVEGIIGAHWKEFEVALDGNIQAVGIDLCKFTRCDNGCQTKHHANEVGIVISANSTVLVGVNSTSEDVCQCPIPSTFDGCSYGYCHNGGICYNYHHPGALCYCKGDLPGERCQGSTRSFNGTGFVWMKTLPACIHLNISLSFRTKDDGVILYNGPYTLDSSYEENRIIYGDYIYVAIEKGELRIKQLNGHREVALKLSSKVTDGKIHNIQIIQNKKRLEAILDYCRGNRKVCYDYQDSDDDERLNVNTPLQIGGLYRANNEDDYPNLEVKAGFKGCIMDLKVNGEQYDLQSPEVQVETSSNCDCDQTKCINGQCYRVNANTEACKCSIGWFGEKCDQRSPWTQFTKPQAFAKFHVKDWQQQDVKTLMITNDAYPTGTIGSLGNDENEISSITLSNGFPGAKIINDSSPIHSALQLLPKIPYLLHFHREHYITSLSIDGKSHTSKVKNGGALEPISSLTIGNGSKSFAGCIRFLHYNDDHFMIREAGEDDNRTPKSGQSIQQRDTKPGCDILMTCRSLASGYCPEGQVCHDHWKGPICVCPEGNTAFIRDDGTLSHCYAEGRLTITLIALIFIILCLILLLLLCLLSICYCFSTPDPIIVEDLRLESEDTGILKNDNLECGETDNSKYNLDNLRRPPEPVPPRQFRAPGDPYADQLDRDPNSGPYDELRLYELEGDNQSTITFESIDSINRGPVQYDHRRRY
ncbi:unnamed protein product [Bursaphelenchus xylophilus]|uniref:(pine wood nematode) hypothetical protein n=1 Tax=Bursaphelenchus xylophilus TaxID=6326 RepID=A0A1I7RRK5_BURXY|nr:unnamed protein product [Bursaphelenchus xylophilus]CAG9131088.1 unnamed protein product [Bursaphelenchus xylophilus]